MAAVGSLQPGMEALHVQGDYKDAPPAKADVVAAVESLQPAMESLHVQDYKDPAPAKGVAAAAAVGSFQPGVDNLLAQDYKDASMYYGAYPAYAYGGNGLFRSVLSVRCFNLYLRFILSPCFFLQSAAYGGWGEYSTYVSHDGAQSPTAVSDSSLFDICCSPYFRLFVTLRLYSIE